MDSLKTNYTDEQFEKLEQEERTITDEAIAVMILLLSNAHSNLEKELRLFYQKYGKDGVVTYAEARKWVGASDHRRRLTALLALVSAELASTHNKLTPEFKSFLTKVIGKESGFFDVEIDEEPVLQKDWGADKSNWQERLANDIALWTLYLGSDIKRLIHRQATIDAVLAQVDKRFKSIKNILEALALTESTAIGSIARNAIFDELGISKYQFYTKEDERRCETCGSMHGLIFPISAYEVGVTASPLHPRCRCWEVPIWD